jgi:ankyrin repeat protein
MRFNLLQLSAARPRTSRSGISIAEHLLQAGVPLEPLPDGTPSALVLAIKNRYFDLADLLIAHGADINVPYQILENGRSGTVLKELLSHHSYASLASTNYLFTKPNVGSMVSTGTNLITAECLMSKVGCTPDFIVDRAQNLSALHILARCALEVMNHKSQISARIIERIMEAFNSPKQINQTHPILGTPLCVAAMVGNVEMVTALLDARAELALSARIPDSLTDVQISALELPDHVLQQR